MKPDRALVIPTGILRADGGGRMLVWLLSDGAVLLRAG